ncbi:MAG: CCA tRNA nucleotidyltransferase [Aquificae bacterium]|nr:CCA tRNA nucleotidyltransferase [Aquificota bacterium]
MLGIERLLEKLFNRRSVPKEEREEISLEDIGTKYIHGLLFYNTYFDQLSQVLGKDTVCFIVGGWIRDRMVNLPLGDKVDVDFLITTEPMEVVKRFKKLLGKGEIFQFEKGKPVATIIFEEDGVRYRFDFSLLDISDIMSNPNLDFYDKEKAVIDRLEEDLKKRDYTINAMAVVFDDALGLGASQTVLFDPTGGLEDLQEGIVRPVSLQNIQEDPVRIVRGYRIANQLDFTLEKEFRKWVKENLHLLEKAPKERIRDELLKILEMENSHKILKEMERDGVLQTVIPTLKDVNKSELNQSIQAVERIEEILKKKW